MRACGAWSRDLLVALQGAARVSLCALGRPVATHGFGRVGAEERKSVRNKTGWIEAGVTYDAHVGDGLLVLCSGGAPSPPVFVLRCGKIHEFNRVYNGWLRFDILRSVGVYWVRVEVVFESIHVGKHLENEVRFQAPVG